MKTSVRMVAVVLILAAAGVAWADLGVPRGGFAPLPRPVPQQPAWKTPAVPLVIEVDDNVQEARLYVPGQFLQFRAELEEDRPNERRAEASPGRFQTTMVGLSLALALAFGGLCLVRQRGLPGGRHLVVFVSTAVFLTIGGVVAWANFAPGPLAPAAKKPPIPAVERVLVEISPRPNDPVVKLIINKDRLAKVLEEANKNAEKNPAKK